MRNRKTGQENKNKCDVFYNTYYNLPLDDNLVYLESRDGLDFTGNILRIAQELSSNPAYRNLRFCVRARGDSVKNKVIARLGMISILLVLSLSNTSGRLSRPWSVPNSLFQILVCRGLMLSERARWCSIPGTEPLLR